MSPASRRRSYWTLWPDQTTGPLWAGVHLHERAGVMAVVGVELFSCYPLDAREDPGPGSGLLNGEMMPMAPVSVRGVDIESLSIGELLKRFDYVPEVAALSGAGGTRGKRYTRDHWRAVAHEVLTTQGRGDRRTAQAVAYRWSVSIPTAKSWIARARREGLLPAAR